MILGDDLEPTEISKALGLRPNQAWRRGETRRYSASSMHLWGGWKKFIPKSHQPASLLSQLNYWVRKLRGKEREILNLDHRGYLCALDCYIGSNGVSTVILPAKLQKAISNLGLELRISFFANDAVG